MAYATVTLTGTYQTPDQTPHKGHVEIIPSERVIKDTTGDVILTGRVKVELDAQGAFSAVLPATDDPTLNPTGFGYTIAAKLHSSHPPAVSFSLPAALGATTVEDLTPVDPSTFAPTTTYAEKSELDAVAATIPTTAADVNALPDTTQIPSTAADVGALPDTTVIPSTPGDVGAEPAGLSTTTQNTLDATYGLPIGNTAVIEGDSRSVNDFGQIAGPPPGTVHYAFGFWHHMAARLRQRFALVGNYAISGSTSADVLARIASSQAHRPSWFFLEVGVNDVRASIPTATTTANIQAIVEAMRSVGSLVVLRTIPTFTYSIQAGMQDAVFTINRWIKEYARQTNGVLLADPAAQLANPSSGDPISGALSDGLHFAPLGGATIGKALADMLDPLVPKVAADLPVSNGDAAVILSNGLMVGNNAGVATSWQHSAVGAGVTSTPTKVARTDGLPGEWQQIVVSGVTAANTGGLLTLESNISGGKWAVGDEVYALAEVETDSGLTNVTKIALRVEAMTSGYSLNTYTEDGTNNAMDYPANLAPRSAVLQTPSITIPANTGLLRVRAYFYGNGTFRLGRVALYKGAKI